MPPSKKVAGDSQPPRRESVRRQKKSAQSATGAAPASRGHAKTSDSVETDSGAQPETGGRSAAAIEAASGDTPALDVIVEINGDDLEDEKGLEAEVEAPGPCCACGIEPSSCPASCTIGH